MMAMGLTVMLICHNFEDITFKSETKPEEEIPEMQYHLYRYIIAIDHFKNEITLFKN